MYPVAALGRLIAASIVVIILLVACGDRSLLNVDPIDTTVPYGDAGDNVDSGYVTPKTCGDGRCVASAGETCANCSVDCGLCAGCGDKSCASDETCESCPQDCGVCASCGDGFCRGGKTCLTCAPDCGKCASCGDKTCDASRGEDCFTCPDDCGKCQGCGDGLCKSPETCASCPHDCGVCAVCGNAKCEPPYETCVNCAKDCGDCTTIGCIEMLTCSTKCIDTQTKPPSVSVTCIADCVSRGCPSAQFFFDQAFNCFIQHLNECGSNFGCLQQKCDPEVAACIGARCPQ
jgi:hypothetical protein